MVPLYLLVNAAVTDIQGIPIMVSASLADSSLNIRSTIDLFLMKV